ncbi:L-aspartate oxidase [Psychromonas sp. RZ22]|uniref:L-aspartate oxidase n=1 Tax=Psychromonas algarum TaxID=2555643 RepID=UPI00106893EB|nr:L-aspartate oxidase [Psychromonas sp. RZ22]TEW53146.1 L-aspartate oxidase [Psychromonas sp. RZ22]
MAENKTTTEQQYTCDVLIVGAGAAGLSLALKIAVNTKVIVLSKGKLSEGSTYYAQGGVAAVFSDDDSIESHFEDTLVAGAGLCDEDAVRFTVSNAKKSMQWLIETGVDFDTEENEQKQTQYHLTREGGHSHRRILHAADATGREIEESLLEAVQKHPNITLMEGFNAIDLITTRKLNLPANRVLGAYVWNRTAERVETINAHFVTLATGGASKVYQYTSNPDVSSGDGIALAWRSGCRVANMEFNQFHPTCLYHVDAKNFLLSEALRGEGALLLRPDGTRFMPDFDERGELAPRDIVARAIDYEMKRLGVDCMYLDISHQPKEFIIKHFPTIYHRCLQLGIDIAEQPMPIVPAAHYTCGGVMIDHHGQTDIDGLYAIGEVTYTGLHGANRLASNSLLECIVYAHACARDITNRIPSYRQRKFAKIPDWDDSQVENSDEQVVIQHNWHELRLFMWDYVGIVRTDKRLQRALSRIELLQHEITEYYSNFKVGNNLLELRNLVQVAELIIKSAIQRKESRGLHYNLDYPDHSDEKPKPTILNPNRD